MAPRNLFLDSMFVWARRGDIEQDLNLLTDNAVNLFTWILEVCRRAHPVT